MGWGCEFTVSHQSGLSDKESSAVEELRFILQRLEVSKSLTPESDVNEIVQPVRRVPEIGKLRDYVLSFPRSSKPTSEQESILERAFTSVDLKIEALAGTGKTSTLKMFADLKVDEKGGYIAFNKSIVNEAKDKFPRNIQCSTAHSLAFQAVGKRYQQRLNGAQRLSFQQVAQWLGAAPFSFKTNISNHRLEAVQVAVYVTKTVRQFAKSVDQEIGRQHVVMPLLVSSDPLVAHEFENMVVSLATKVWVDLEATDGFMKFTHDHYLKLWQLTSPRLPFDFILFDEAQDADPVILDVIEGQKSAQRIYCGDQFQSIYEWRGARNALREITFDESQWLTQSFRFGDEVAREANVFLDRLKSEYQVRGYTRINSRVGSVENPEAVLCRTNAGVMAEALFQQERGRRVAIIGSSDEIVAFAKACEVLMNGRRTGHTELAPFTSWNEVVSFVKDHPEEASEIKTMVDMVDKYGTQRLVNASRLLVEENFADVVISTAHRAKGREWRSVKLNGDFAHIDDMQEEDLRLAYVAVTRAREELDLQAWKKAERRIKSK
jgi:hypothetical protein